MATRPQAPVLDLSGLLPSWELALRAERKSPATIKSYGDGVRRFLDWCADHDQPTALERATLSAFTADLLDGGAEPATARSRHLAVRRFSAWLLEEGEQDVDNLIGVRSPKLDEKVTEPFSDEDLRRLLKACAGTDMRDRRDEAIVRFMVETCARAGETAALSVADVDLTAGTAVVRRGKGGKGRVVPLGAQTARAIDRYLRARRSHRLAASPALWLGDRGKAFGYDALHKTLTSRAAAAGLEGFHPHRLRHTGAHRWLAAGGSEGGLMAVAGWTRPDMLLRYTKAQASARAAEEARRLNLGGPVTTKLPTREQVAKVTLQKAREIGDVIRVRDGRLVVAGAGGSLGMLSPDGAYLGRYSPAEGADRQRVWPHTPAAAERDPQAYGEKRRLEVRCGRWPACQGLVATITSTRDRPPQLKVRAKTCMVVEPPVGPGELKYRFICPTCRHACDRRVARLWKTFAAVPKGEEWQR